MKIFDDEDFRWAPPQMKYVKCISWICRSFHKVHQVSLFVGRVSRCTGASVQFSTAEGDLHTWPTAKCGGWHSPEPSCDRTSDGTKPQSPVQSTAGQGHGGLYADRHDTDTDTQRGARSRCGVRTGVVFINSQTNTHRDKEGMFGIKVQQLKLRETKTWEYNTGP